MGTGAIAVSNAIVSADMQAADATDRFNIASLIVILTLMLLHDSVATRLGALRWFHLLQSKLPMIVFGYVDEFVPALLKVLSDPSEKVVGFDLKVLAALSSCESPDDESGKEVGAHTALRCHREHCALLTVVLQQMMVPSVIHDHST